MEASANRRGGYFKRIGLAILGFALSVAGLFYVFSGIEIGRVFESANRIKVVPLVISVAAYWLLLVVLRALLVRHLLVPVGAVGFGRAYRCICIGFLANNVLPFRAGDIARSAALSRGAGISFTSVIGGLALERLLDMAMVALLALAAIQVAPLPETVRSAAPISSAVLAAAFVVLFILVRRLGREADETAMGPIKSKLWKLWVRFSTGLGALESARGILLAVVLSVAVWAIALGVMVLRLSAFDLQATIPLGLVLLTCLGFGVALPSAPAYVGVYHAAAAFALELFGVDHTTAVAFALFSWVLDVGMGCLAGAVGLTVEGLRLGDLKRGESVVSSGDS